jgi:histidyl-tRNA synthetase
MSVIDVQPVNGTRDFYPEDQRIRSWLFGLWREVAQRFGYEEYDACVLEHEELYVRKAGDEVTEQLYNFVDKGGRRLALRPELTPSLARMVIAKGAALPLPARWFAIPQCFRYERTQRGRKREHFQWNMDVIGLASVAAEAELMAAQHAFLARTGLRLEGDTPDIVFRVSNRQVLGQMLESMGIAGERFGRVCVVIDKRGKVEDAALVEMLGAEGVQAEIAQRILSLLDTAGPGRAGLAAVAAQVPADNPGLKALTELMDLAEAFGYGHLVRIDLSVIRGLSYYTGTVWEVFDATGSLPRAIAGGGRYDNLAAHLGGQATPMVGFGFGDVVITEILRERGLLPTLGKGLDDVVYPMGPKAVAMASRIAATLRAQGRNVAVDYTLRRFKHAIERAEADGAKRLLILGGDELAKGVVKVRTLGSQRDEREVAFAELGVSAVG